MNLRRASLSDMYLEIPGTTEDNATILLLAITALTQHMHSTRLLGRRLTDPGLVPSTVLLPLLDLYLSMFWGHHVVAEPVL